MSEGLSLSKLQHSTTPSTRKKKKNKMAQNILDNLLRISNNTPRHEEAVYQIIQMGHEGYAVPALDDAGRVYIDTINLQIRASNYFHALYKFAQYVASKGGDITQLRGVGSPDVRDGIDPNSLNQADWEEEGIKLWNTDYNFEQCALRQFGYTIGRYGRMKCQDCEPEDCFMCEHIWSIQIVTI